MDRNAPIGVFDSGVGGLTVMREIMRQMPDERIVYFGDTARVPYGNKSKETVIRYSHAIRHQPAPLRRWRRAWIFRLSA